MPRTFTGHSTHRYTRDSVERALTLHLGEGGPTGWTRKGDGYVVPTGVGLMTLPTLKATYVFVVGLAEGKRRVAAQ